MSNNRLKGDAEGGAIVRRRWQQTEFRSGDVNSAVGERHRHKEGGHTDFQGYNAVFQRRNNIYLHVNTNYTYLF